MGLTILKKAIILILFYSAPTGVIQKITAISISPASPFALAWAIVKINLYAHHRHRDQSIRGACPCTILDKPPSGSVTLRGVTICHEPWTSCLYALQRNPSKHETWDTVRRRRRFFTSFMRNFTLAVAIQLQVDAHTLCCIMYIRPQPIKYIRHYV